MKSLTNYIEISKQLTKLQIECNDKKNEMNSFYSSQFSTLKSNLDNYFSQINPTVEIVCKLHNRIISYTNGNILFNNMLLKGNYSFENVCNYAIQIGNEGINYLALAIQNNNVEENLKQFAARYNTLHDIYINLELLKKESIESSVSVLNYKIDELLKKQTSIFKSDYEYKTHVNNAISNTSKYKKENDISNRINLEQSFKNEISLSLGYETIEGKLLNLSSDVVTSVLNWKLEKDGLMVVKTNNFNNHSKQLASIVVNTSLKFLFSYPGTFKQVLLCDSTSNHEITSFAGSLKDVNSKLIYGKGSYVNNSSDDIHNKLVELNKLINDRIMLIGGQSYDNILDYNLANQDNPQSIIFVVLNGYPNRYESSSDDLESIFQNGKKAGIYCLVNENTLENDDSKYYRKSMPKLFNLTSNIYELSNNYLVKNNIKYDINIRDSKFNIGSILTSFKENEVVSDNKVIYLDNVVEKEDFKTSKRRKEFSKNLSIPIGKQGANPINIELRADDSTAHLAVIGTTGSGKTAFINSLVLSAAKLYSPDELEFHLIVMVKGDFRIFEEEKLPHLKTVVTGDRLFAAADVLDFLETKMKQRGEIIGSLGSIYEYNKTASKPLSRCVIIIDEFMQLVAGSDNAIKRIESIAQVGRAYGISLVISSTSFPMEVNSIKPLMGNRVEFKAGESAGQLIPEASNRQGELENVKGVCFYSHSGKLYNLRVAFSEEGDAFKKHINDIKTKYPNYKMEIQSEIKSQLITKETDVLYSSKRVRSDYEDGIIRTRLGKIYLSNKSLEYPIDSKNNLLFLFGHYLSTKTLEASLIKDVLVLSKDIDEPTVYYLDMNRNTALRRANNTIKANRDNWIMSGKMVYASGDDALDLMSDIKDLIETRETDDESDLYPVLVVVSKAESIFEDDDNCEELCELINRGKENNVYFVCQCSEPIRFYGCDKYMKNAIVFPDRYQEGDDYSSTALCEALEAMPAGATDKGRKLIANATLSALNPKLHILCNGNNLTIFIPYEYSEEYLSKIVK